MRNLVHRFRVRQAHRRLSRSLDRLTEDRLEMASCLNNWIRTTNLLPGDCITLSFDGEHTDVVILDIHNEYFIDGFRKTIDDLKNET